MAMKTKAELKDVFSGIGSALFQKIKIDTTKGTASGGLTLAPDFDLPVHVDDIGLSEGETTVNHYKIHGMDTDWVATSTKGDFELNLLVPTLHEDVLKLAYGEDAVSEFQSSYGGKTWKGKAWQMSKYEVKGSLILVNEAEDAMLILPNVKLWASLVMDNPSTDPIGIKLAGTIESGDKDVIFLKKQG